MAANPTSTTVPKTRVKTADTASTKSTTLLALASQVSPEKVVNTQSISVRLNRVKTVPLVPIWWMVSLASADLVLLVYNVKPKSTSV
jgi:hypothetical protein